MTALKGKAAVKMGMECGKRITDSRFLQASKMKTKKQFQGYCQCSS